MRSIVCATALFALGACGQNAPAAPSAQPTPPVAENSTLGVSSLSALTEADFTTPLNGELGCSFMSGDDVLLVAKGNVDRAARSEALVSADGAATRLVATEAGGYDGMVEGASFSTGALTVEVQTSTRAETGDEQVAYTSTLTAQSGGEVRSYGGRWVCGP